MTREEAIELIESARKTMYLPKSKEYISDFGYALEMAIKALSQEPCEDAVNRDMALEKMADYVASGYADSVKDFEEYSRIICQLPPVTSQPKTGHWIPRNSFLLQYRCSECGRESEKYNYCPNCGAMMIEPQERSGEE